MEKSHEVFDEEFWFWCTEWCTERNLSPWNPVNWERANEAYDEMKSKESPQ